MKYAILSLKEAISMKKMIGFNKGVNFGGWLSQCNYEKEHLDTFITENDFKIAASWGLDHIRVPFDYNILENEDGSFSEEYQQRVGDFYLG